MGAREVGRLYQPALRRSMIGRRLSKLERVKYPGITNFGFRMDMKPAVSPLRGWQDHVILTFFPGADAARLHDFAATRLEPVAASRRSDVFLA